MVLFGNPERSRARESSSIGGLQFKPRVPTAGHVRGLWSPLLRQRLAEAVVHRPDPCCPRAPMSHRRSDEKSRGITPSGGQSGWYFLAFRLEPESQIEPLSKLRTRRGVMNVPFAGRLTVSGDGLSPRSCLLFALRFASFLCSCLSVRIRHLPWTFCPANQCHAATMTH